MDTLTTKSIVQMKAAIRRKYGPFESLEVGEIEKPLPKEKEVLVRVHATTVNRTDCAVVTGWPFAMRFFTGLFGPKHPVPGTDFAGVIESVGEKVTQFQAGQQVWGFLDDGLSSQAEYMVIAEQGNIDPMPEGLSFEEATSCLEGAHYAYNFLKKLDLAPGDKVLLNGATGGIGSAMLQMLKAQNIYVTAVCNTQNIELIQSLGADKIYDYLQEDFTQDTGRYRYIFDAVGKSSFGKCKHLLEEGGAYLSSELGPGWENLYLPLFTARSSRKVIFPLPADIKGSMQYIKGLVEAGKFRPVIDRTYPLERIAEAYTFVASGQKTGNVVIRMGE